MSGRGNSLSKHLFPPLLSKIAFCPQRIHHCPETDVNPFLIIFSVGIQPQNSEKNEGCTQPHHQRPLDFKAFLSPTESSTDTLQDPDLTQFISPSMLQKAGGGR